MDCIPNWARASSISFVAAFRGCLTIGGTARGITGAAPLSVESDDVSVAVKAARSKKQSLLEQIAASYKSKKLTQLRQVAILRVCEYTTNVH